MSDRMRLQRAGGKLLGLGATVIAATLLSAADGGERDRLREITQNQCVPHWLREKDPAPCISVTIQARSTPLRGYSILADRKGGAHFLLIPLEPVSGIESAGAWAPGAPNYFQDAWEARRAVAKVVGHDVSRTAIGLAINSLYTRSQDQLHIHIECLGKSVHDVLTAGAVRIGESWSPIEIGKFQYQALRVMGADLGHANPFALLAERLPGAKDSMGAYTLLRLDRNHLQYVVGYGPAEAPARAASPSDLALIFAPTQGTAQRVDGFRC
jgi:CDP-diacylglycerol pyrophosphatase